MAAEKNNKYFRAVLWFLFLVYLVLLIKVILFKYPLHMTLESLSENSFELFKRRVDTANLEPFRTIKFYLTTGRVGFNVRSTNLLANIISFMPLGFILPLLRPKSTFLSLTGLALAVSLFFEVTQLATGIGSFDIDDLILNVLGAWAGYISVVFFASLMEKKNNGGKSGGF